MSVNNKKDASFLLRLLKNLKFVIEVKQRNEHSTTSVHDSDDNAIQMPEKTGSISSLSGIWKDYDISIETIRKKSWDRS